jgi:pentatricopeptide repeat protein
LKFNLMVQIAFTSFPLRLIFERLSVDNLIRVVEMLLLERQVLLLSSHYSVLTVAAEGLLSLLFPFSWQHVYIPFLPQAALDFVHAPMPFLIGTHRSFFKDLSQLPDGVGVIDLDRNTIRMPMNYDEEEACLVTDQVPLLPEKERSKLVEQLHEAVAGVYTAGDKSTMAAFADFDLAFQNAPPPDMDDEEDEETAVPAEFHERNARDAFFRVFVSMLRTYRDYINFPVATNPQPVECFDMSGYLKKQPEQSHEFFRQFCETQAFQRFIEDRMYPSENHSQVLFFDESVVAKLNRSTFTKSRETPFLNDKSFAITKTFVASAADTTGLRPEGYVYQHWPTLDQSLFTPPRYVAPLETETLRSTAINKHKKTASAQGSSGSAGGSSSSSTATVQAASTASSAGGSSSTNSFSSPPGYLSRATAEANTYAIWFMLLDATSKKGVLRPIDLCPVYDIYQRIKVEQLVVDEIVYRSMLDCCGKAGCPDLAFKILEDMQRDRIQPDAQTYASLIAALEVSGHVLPQTKANMPISHLAEQFKQAMIAAGQLAVIQPKINGAAAAVPALPRQLSLTSSFDSVANPQSPSAGAAGADASAEPASSISASSFFDIYVPTGPIAPRKALRMSPLQQNEYYVSLFEHAFPGLSITTSEACSSCNRTHLDKYTPLSIQIYFL